MLIKYLKQFFFMYLRFKLHYWFTSYGYVKWWIAYRRILPSGGVSKGRVCYQRSYPSSLTKTHILCSYLNALPLPCVPVLSVITAREQLPWRHTCNRSTHRISFPSLLETELNRLTLLVIEWKRFQSLKAWGVSKHWGAAAKNIIDICLL